MQCRMEIPKTEGEETLTVGRVFNLLCEGEWPQLNPETLKLVLDKENEHKLKLLGFEFRSKTEAQLTLTSYRTGDHNLKALQLVDAEHSVVLGDLQFTVKSVMNPQEPATEPYGPFGPFELSLPLWYPLSILLLLAVAGGLIWRRIHVDRQKKKLLAQMQVLDSSVAPYFQFYQALRKIQRGFSFYSGAEPSQQETTHFIDCLNQAYKIYLARQFLIPTLKWNERKILSDLKRNHKNFYSDFRLEIRKALAELSRAQDPKALMGGKDCDQLAQLLRHQVDAIEQWLKGKPT